MFLQKQLKLVLVILAAQGKILSRLWLLASISLISSFADASSNKPILISHEKGKYFLGEYLSYLEDKDGEFTIAQILDKDSDLVFKQNYTKVANMGITNSVFWFKGSITFPDDYEDVELREDYWIMEIADPLLFEAVLYFHNEDGVYQRQRISKAKVNIFQTEPKPRDVEENVEHRNFIFYVDEGNTQRVDFILRIEPLFKILLPLILWKVDNFVDSENTSLYFLGLYFGLMFAMALYNVCVYLIVRDKNYLYFIAYILANIGVFLGVSGQGYQLIWSAFPGFNSYSLIVSAVVVGVTLLLFTDKFLEVQDFSKPLHRMINLGIFLFIISLFGLTVSYLYVVLFITFLLCIYFTLILYISFLIFSSGDQTAKLFFPSVIVLTVGSSIYLGSAYNIIPNNAFTSNTPYVGSALQAILLSLALAGQLIANRKESYEALLRENTAIQNLRDLEESVLEKATTDPLTKLPNRARLQSLALEMSSDVIRRNSPVAVIVIQLKGMQEVNNTLGLQNGDEILEKVAKRLNSTVSSFDNCVKISELDGVPQYVAAVDSSSFALFFDMKEEKNTYIEYGNHIISLVNRPLEFHGMSIDILARAGMAFCPEHSTNIITLVRFAQIASESGQGSRRLLEIYSAALDKYTSKKLVIVGDLRRSLQEMQLQLYFQPQVDISSDTVVGIEALARWKHPEYDYIPPDEFIPLAEKTGIIHPLTEWLLEEAFFIASSLQDRNYDLRMSVNISVRNILEKDFVEKVVNCLDRHHLSYDAVVLEVTETAMMTEPEKALKVLKDLFDLGISIAIDDYGSGFSSLSYIKQLPLSEIKIDREFIKNIEDDHNDRIISKTTIAMAHSMGFSVCAEGVETEAAYNILKSYECDIVQGYYVAKPMPESDFVEWLENTKYKVNNKSNQSI